MSQNPINLIVRFALEIVIWVALGMWGYHKGEGWKGIVLAILLPVAGAAIWGIFRTVGDHGRGLVETPGLIRFAMEMLFFTAAAWVLYDLGYQTSSFAFIAVSLLHYILSYDRVVFLISGE
ncbi:MAG: YrdB family protein [Saprospirales bacterium]|nr:YrdB family protein [Saprospirales bacterium]